MVSSANGAASQMACRSFSNDALTSGGWLTMYSSTFLATSPFFIRLNLLVTCVSRIFDSNKDASANLDWILCWKLLKINQIGNYFYTSSVKETSSIMLITYARPIFASS